MDRSHELAEEGAAAARERRLRALFVQAAGGDAAAYRAFLDELAGCLRAFLRRRLDRFPNDVEDLVQETLLAVHNQRHTYDARAPLTPWAYGIARYKWVDFLRRHGRGDALTDPLDDADALLDERQGDALDARRDVAKLLATLPPKQRDAIALVKLEGLSTAEAAQRTGLSESAVKVSVHRGLKALAARLRSTP